MLKTCKQDCWQPSDSLKNLILVVAEAQEVQMKDYRYPDNYLKPKHNYMLLLIN